MCVVVDTNNKVGRTKEKSVYLLGTVPNMQEMSTDSRIQRQVELSTVEMLSGLVKHGQNFARLK